MNLLVRNPARALLAAAGLALAASAPAAQAAAPGGADAQATLDRLRPPRIVPATPFRWGADQRGTVDYEVGLDGGWIYWPPSAPVMQFRFLPSVTADPLIEVILYAPYSGSGVYNERFKLQLPLGGTGELPALVIAFHSWSVSEQQIFNPLQSDLAETCAEKGWMLLAPYGLNDVNFGNAPSQQALTNTLLLIDFLLDYDKDRVYALGFSMGGVNAASYALRHQDPYRDRIAGVIYHTGSTDVVRSYEDGEPAVQAILEDPAVFGGSPSEVPYAYDRINPIRYTPDHKAFDPAFAAVDSTLHLPWYMFVNVTDPNPVADWTIDLREHLVQAGAEDLTARWTNEPQGVHHYSTMDFVDALDWAETKTLPPLPDEARIFADREARYLHTRVRALPDETVARYSVTVSAATNGFTVADTHGLDELGLDLDLMGLDPAATIAFSAGSGDGTADTYVLEGYPLAPSAVLVDGGPPVAWSHDPVTAELAITPTADGSTAAVIVTP